MQFVKIALPLAALACAVAASVEAGTLISGYIGCHKLSLNVREVASTATFSVKGPVDYLAITEVYPDTPGSAQYHYRVSAKGIDDFERRRRGVGFGPETCFIRVKSSPIGAITLTNLAKAPVRILRVWGVTKAELDKLLADDSFRILGITSAAGDDGEALVKMLAENLHPKPEYGITTGFSAEIRYANRPADAVRGELANCAKWSKQYSMPAMLGIVSWWSGTPLWEPDGLGGRFGDVKYQQVCYAPDTEQPEDADLKALLGDRYNRHYCLSVPNEWSSVPWLTMNSKRLNDYRCKRLNEAIAILRELNGGDTKWIDNIYLENEPRYWDTHCEAGNDKRHAGTIWADFNPLAVAGAKRDGVDLNPADGLSEGELCWLHRNVGRYNQETADAARKSLKKHGLPSDLPIYSHSLQHRDMFPGGPIGHPVSEWAYIKGVRTGIEGMWTQPSDFARVREWGRWANINREEGDGRPIEEHLWDLRVDYMMGGDLFNSYNWSVIGAQRFFDYVDEFLRGLPTTTLAPAEAKLIDARSLAVKTPMRLQAFTRVDVPIEVAKAVRGEARLTVADKDGRLVASSRGAAALKAGKSVLAFEFADSVECPSADTFTFRIDALDGGGRPISDAIRLTQDSISGIKLSLDLRTQRALSLAVIARTQASLNPLP